MSELSQKAEEMLAAHDSTFRMLALAQMHAGRAFCPACRWAGISNCGSFDECNFIMPSGKTADEEEDEKP